MQVTEDENDFTFIWKIENFSMLPHQNGEALMSPEFVVDMWEGIKWHLKLYPRGKSDENLDHVSCFLQATDTEMKEFKINVFLALETTDLSNEITKNGNNKLKKFRLGCGWGKFSSLAEIYAKKDIYLPHDVFSLRCCLSPTNSNNVELTVNNEIERATNLLNKIIIFRTGIQVQQLSFTWPIQNVSTRRERVQTSFIINDSPGLKVTLNFSKVANNISVPIEIQQTAPAPFDEKQERLFVKCKITVLSVDKDHRDSKESTHLFKLALNDVWHFPLFIKTVNLTHDKYLNQEDTLFLQCEFAFSHKNRVYHWEDASRKFGDVELKAGGETFPAHKFVLCARSSVFSAMFENDLKEKIPGVVEIDDVDPPTLKRMLTFINFDDIKEKDLSPKDVCKLYKASVKFNIVSLKGWCTIFLLTSLAVECVNDILVLADAHHDNFLMTSACNFVCCHEAEIFDSSHWENFMDSNPKLSAKVMHQVFVNKKRK